MAISQRIALRKWQKYWNNQTSPYHRCDTQEHYQQYALELKILFGNKVSGTTLEIGCGNGALYEYLGFNLSDSYKGIDFSPTMLEVFKKDYPNVNLECSDGSAYCDNNTYDLIFSNGVIQNFDTEMLKRHFENASKMMNKDSLFICASIPWKSQKIKYLSGELGGVNQPNRIKGYLSYFKSFRKDSMGFWYDFREITKIARSYDMSIEFYASMHYMYRFHAVMKSK